MSEKISDADIARIAEALAPKLIDGVKERNHDFWIDPETHYQDHLTWRSLDPDEVHSIKDLIKVYKATRGLFWKAFIGFAIIGAIAMTAVGMGFNKT